MRIREDFTDEVELNKALKVTLEPAQDKKGSISGPFPYKHFPDLFRVSHDEQRPPQLWTVTTQLEVFSL